MAEPAPRHVLRVDLAAEVLIRGLLLLPSADVASIRTATPGRARPRVQYGPSAEYGDESGSAQ